MDFFFPLLGCIFGGGGGRLGAQPPKPCPKPERREGSCGGPTAPGSRGVRLVNHCRPLSPALGAHWKTLVNQQMMASNFPISRASKGCSFLQLAEERRRPPGPDFAPHQGPAAAAPRRGLGTGRTERRSTAAQSPRPRQQRAERHQSGESSGGNSIPTDRSEALPAGGGGQRGEGASSPPPAPPRRCCILDPGLGLGALPRGPGAVDQSLPSQRRGSCHHHGHFPSQDPAEQTNTHRAKNRSSLSAVNVLGRVCRALVEAEGRARARRAVPGWPGAHRPGLGCGARRPRHPPGRAAGSGSAEREL